MNKRKIYTFDSNLGENLIVVVDEDYVLQPGEVDVTGLKLRDGKFEGTEVVAPTPPKTPITRLSKVDFMDRLTFAELEAIEEAADSPGQAKNKMRVVMKYLDAAQEIDLSSDRLSNLLDILVQFNIIDEARKTEILTIEEV